MSISEFRSVYGPDLIISRTFVNRPLLLLLGTGVMLGLNFPLGKLAIAAGVEPALWAALISLGAGCALWIVTRVGEHRRDKAASFDNPSPTPPRKGEGSLLRYAIVSGFLSYVVPNFLTFSAIPKIGSGLAAIMFALSPVMTAALSILFKVRPPSAIGLLGIALGLLGALVIIVFRGENFSVGSGFWLGAALLIPVFLGIGNLYRTMAWPEGARPRKLAAMTNLAAVPPLLLIAFFQTGTLNSSPLLAVPGLAALQVAVSTIMFLMFFRLQQLGGPTYLSQIGYVAAAVGVVIGVVWLGEKYPAGVWVGAAIIAEGIALSTYAQVRQR
jgi:drug/metabolite transporter (DMT)-like permease